MDSIQALGKQGSIQSLYNALSGMTAGDHQVLADAFSQLHGEVYAANKIVGANMQRRFLRLLPNHETNRNNWSCPRFRGQCGKTTSWSRWASFTGDWMNLGNTGGYSGYDLHTAGVAVGSKGVLYPGIGGRLSAGENVV